jgi:hypothetical protein
VKLTGKPWLLFCGNDCYPAGGVKDYVGDYISLADAESHMRLWKLSNGNSWAHITNVHTQEIHEYRYCHYSSIAEWFEVCGECRKPTADCWCNFEEEWDHESVPHS